MKLDKVSIKWRMFAYLLAFVAAMLLLLWLFQIVFLESFYKSIKSNSIKSSADTIAKNIDNEDLSSLVDELARQNDICVRILDEFGNDLYSQDSFPDCAIHKLKISDIQKYWDKASSSDGAIFEQWDRNGFRKDGIPREEQFIGKISVAHIMPQSMISAQVVTRGDGSSILLLLNSNITPINATVETLRIQLIYITLILAVLAILLSFIISRNISKPIIKMNQSAKDLARASYDTHFDGTGYLEIAELSDSLNYAAHELSKVEGLRRELIANVSHDLRTPLTLISGYAEMIRDIPGESTPENVQVIIDESRRLTTLVNDMLDISKFESGSQELSMERFNLTADIRDILTRYTKMVQKEGYRFVFEEEGDAFVCADQLRIGQVLYNLINNAVTYTGENRTVTLRQICSETHVTIQVMDTGSGIAPEDIPLIWDRYYKVDKAHKRAAVGTGLGLSIVKQALILHHAQFGVESTPGEGSCFWFTLPLDS